MAAVISAIAGVTAYALGASAMTALAVGATAGSLAQGHQAGKQQKKIAQQSAAQAEQMAARQEAQADQAFNRANKKKPNAGAMAAANQQAALAGGAGTMLTGPMGVAPDELQLGKNTLLGQ
jgi:hypothetical protein